VSSDAKVESEPVWKRASGEPLSRQTSEGDVGRYGTTFTRQPSTDVGKEKPLTRQLSKGVSEKKSIIPRVQINLGLCKPHLAVETDNLNKFPCIYQFKGLFIGHICQGSDLIIRKNFTIQKCLG